MSASVRRQSQGVERRPLRGPASSAGRSVLQSEDLRGRSGYRGYGADRAGSVRDQTAAVHGGEEFVPEAARTRGAGRMRPLIPTLALLLSSCAHLTTHAANPRMIVIGVDGMDPVFLEQHWSSLPNLHRLSQ